MTLFDFSNASDAEIWRAIDDRVMGGVSQSEFATIALDGKMMGVFRGELSLRNRGGFCSVRAPLGQRIQFTAQHLSISCRNTMTLGSKSYYLNLRMSEEFDGISYRTSFVPDEKLSTFEFTQAEFQPVFRGRSVPNAAQLQFHEVEQIGLMIADRQTGPFELIVSQIGAF